MKRYKYLFLSSGICTSLLLSGCINININTSSSSSISDTQSSAAATDAVVQSQVETKTQTTTSAVENKQDTSSSALTTTKATTKSTSKSTTAAKTAAQMLYDKYSKFSGYSYYDSTNSLKYYFEFTKDKMFLHCFFQSDSAKKYEDVYNLDLNTAEDSTSYLKIKKVADGNGNDISDRFEMLDLIFEDEAVTMLVIADETRLAGGSGDNITTGTYVFVP